MGAVSGRDISREIPEGMSPDARETWPMHRTGYLTDSLPALQQPLGRVRLAGSDIADGWGGFIDGAIDSGLKAARAILTTPQPVTV